LTFQIETSFILRISPQRLNPLNLHAEAIPLVSRKFLHNCKTLDHIENEKKIYINSSHNPSRNSLLRPNIKNA
jgi:hypothetical protein